MNISEMQTNRSMANYRRALHGDDREAFDAMILRAAGAASAEGALLSIMLGHEREIRRLRAAMEG